MDLPFASGKLTDILNRRTLRNSFAFPVFYDGEGDGNEEESEEENEGGEGSGDTGSTGNTEGSVKDPEKKRLSDEAAKYRVEAKEAKEAKDKAEARIREFEDKDRSDQEKAERDRDEAKAENERLSGIVMKQSVRLAFFESGAAALFRNPATALKVLDLDGIEPDKDGVVDAKLIKERADQLLKTDSYLAVNESESGNESSNDQPSGRQMNGGKKSNRELDEQKIRDKFPALRR